MSDTLQLLEQHLIALDTLDIGSTDPVLLYLLGLIDLLTMEEPPSSLTRTLCTLPCPQLQE